MMISVALFGVVTVIVVGATIIVADRLINPAETQTRPSPAGSPTVEDAHPSLSGPGRQLNLPHPFSVFVNGSNDTPASPPSCQIK